VLNNAVRDGLRVVHAKTEKPFRQRTFDMGLPLVDLTKANAVSSTSPSLARIAYAEGQDPVSVLTLEHEEALAADTRTIECN
jgi:hypothetical protein